MASPGFAMGFHQQPPTASSGEATASSERTQRDTKTEAKAAQAEITEENLRKRLIGTTWYLRGAWLSDSLEFSMRGEVLGHPTKGAFTLALVRIEKVHLTRREVELEGTRYALHFLGALPYENPKKSVEEIRITPKKKFVRLVIAREQVVKPKKSEKKEKNASKTEVKDQAAASTGVAQTDGLQTGAWTDHGTDHGTMKTNPNATTTESPAVAEETLEQALDRIFAATVDKRMLATLPESWQLYYKAQEVGHAPEMDSAGVLAGSAVDRSARLMKAVEPASNEYAQANGIAGRALYRVVVEANGKPGSIAIMRPIGFGLDENAIAAIESATFAPAMKSGHPVAEALDLAVMFRIYSKRTGALAKRTTTTAPALPGPYSVKEQ